MAAPRWQQGGACVTVSRVLAKWQRTDDLKREFRLGRRTVAIGRCHPVAITPCYGATVVSERRGFVAHVSLGYQRYYVQVTS